MHAVTLSEDFHPPQPLLLTAVATMMYSAGSIFVACYKTNSVTDPDLLLLAFVYIVAAIDRIHHDVELTLEDLQQQSTGGAEVDGAGDEVTDSAEVFKSSVSLHSM